MMRGRDWSVTRRVAYIIFVFFSSVNALLNPILPGWNPDPSIVRVGSDYFIATSTFEYFPGHPIYHSKNLVDWKLIGHALNRPSQLTLFGTPSDAGVWAPGLRYHNGIFYLTSTTRYVYTSELRLFPRSFYVTTKDIFSNKWSEPVYFDFLGYDADLFWDTNGDVYCTWSGINNNFDKIYGIWQSKVDLLTGNSLIPAELIFQGILPNNSSARPEGPHIYRVNGTYYLLIAEGGTDIHHRATIQRGPSPSGPWENNPNNPILFNGADLSLPVQDTGHADLVEGPDGSWWGVALGVRPQAQNFSHIQLGRETFLFPVTWENGWPIFNGGRPLTEHIEDVLQDKSPLRPYFNDFSSHELDQSFYFIRTPYKPFHSLAARPGWLRLYGNAYAPGDRDSAALVVRKQTSYEETFETRLDFAPTSNLTEAGISVYYGDLLHNEIGVTGDPDGGPARHIVIRTIVQATQVGPWALTTSNSTITTVKYLPITSPSAPVRLKIVGNSTSYSLGYAESEDNDFSFPVTIDSIALSVAPAGGFFFKGVSFGVYNTGNGKPTLAHADFEYWKQTPALSPSVSSSGKK
ncbi:Non-reducing end alpha-L-arabinofuranosidase BoGH43B [Hypsizygus marmoreus]|uniref:Non-reducing end alpha-L-arabinofuranosidase BoGH43B n=1 Tax=Hypsizygus marmoreus TaxID=39966 RepID=A0A369JRD8_HYPMA|nr:Non-reducing end alpha-L-arabinofuranosidase BoGH43B [Hypsizygus marmoreus]